MSILLLVIICCRVILCANDWESLSWKSMMVQLPREDSNMAVAYYNDSIFIFGGKSYASQELQYNILSGFITDIGQNHLDLITMNGNSKYYTQIEHLFYAIDPLSDPSNIIVYNLITKQILSTVPELIQNVGEDGCLASIHDQLFVIGGRNNEDPLSTTQIYNTSSQKWSIGVSMSTARAYHTCATDTIDSVLYAIGGISSNGGSSLRSIEKIDFDGIITGTASWQNIQNMTVGVRSASAIQVRSTHQIYIFSGIEISNDYGVTAAKPHIIYCASGNVLSLNIAPSSITDFGTLSPIYATAAIAVHNIMYVFGGYKQYDLTTLDLCQSLHLFPTLVPTKYPTTEPTESPTKNPTTEPTESAAPTKNPSSPITLTTDRPTLYVAAEPTSRPTYPEAEVNGDDEDDDDDDDDDKSQNDAANQNDNKDTYAVMIIATIVLFAVCFVFVICIYYRFKQKQKLRKGTLQKQKSAGSELRLSVHEPVPMNTLDVANVQLIVAVSSDSHAVGEDGMTPIGEHHDTLSLPRLPSENEGNKTGERYDCGSDEEEADDEDLYLASDANAKKRGTTTAGDDYDKVAINNNEEDDGEYNDLYKKPKQQTTASNADDEDNKDIDDDDDGDDDEYNDLYKKPKQQTTTGNADEEGSEDI